ncbi:outer membrane beta-barrel protein [uncultured Chitinophaga sp.]|jgi:hypothetical protein|uniref:outer membrane beta-barrel protein n=1 Tax=uncultured Chitinophaga sp. TaxID=339340 RepID=UPI00262DA7BC|nr:outer membrane beta-barrel protein [uncultured Chitinophaga sp.]
MQRILLSLCTGTLLLFAQPKAQAQEQPASFKRNLIGGTLGFGYSTDKNATTTSEGTSTSISVAPVYAHYLSATFAIGASLTYAYNKNENSGAVNRNEYNLYSFGPFVRFEIPLWQSRFSIYNDLGLYGSYIKSTQETDSVHSKMDYWGAGAFYEPGLMFRLKSNIALQASLGRLVSYDYQKNDLGYSHSFGIRSSRNGTEEFRIGINFLF